MCAIYKCMHAWNEYIIADSQHTHISLQIANTHTYHCRQPKLLQPWHIHTHIVRIHAYTYIHIQTQILFVDRQTCCSRCSACCTLGCCLSGRYSICILRTEFRSPHSSTATLYIYVCMYVYMHTCIHTA